MNSSKKKVILDTDIGSDIDDALALAYLLREPCCELLGVTTLTGQPDLRAEMVSAVCRNIGRGDIPIHVGCSEPLIIAQRQPEAAQASRLGDWPREKFSMQNTAVEFLRDTIRKHPGEITLLTIGPLTNIATLFALDPEIPSLLAEHVLMCGNFSALHGEWNAVLDPHATAIAYGNTARAQCPVHLSYGFDITTQVTMHRDQVREKLRSAPVLAPVADFAEVWFERYSELITWHDPLAAVGIFHRDAVCTYREGDISVPLDGVTAGWTIPLHSDSPRHRFASTVNAKKFFDIYFETVK